MEIEIKDDLIKSAMNEFWHKHPNWYGLYMGLLGGKINRIANDSLNQDEYIAEWKDKSPPDSTDYMNCEKCRNNGRITFCAYCTHWLPMTLENHFIERKGD